MNALKDAFPIRVNTVGANLDATLRRLAAECGRGEVRVTLPGIAYDALREHLMAMARLPAGDSVTGAPFNHIIVSGILVRRGE